MEVVADLHVLAQVAITLGGFTGIIGVLQSRGGRELTDLQRMHLAGMLFATVLVGFLAFIPSWVSRLFQSGEEIWFWSIRILLATHLLAWVISVPYWKRGGLMLKAFPPIDQLGTLLILVIGVVAVAAEVYLVFGHSLHLAPFVYEGVLIFFLGMGLFSFVRLLLERPE